MTELTEMDSDILVSFDYPDAGRPLKAIACPIRMSETPADLRFRPPLPGEHTDAVIEEILGEEPVRRRSAGTSE